MAKLVDLRSGAPYYQEWVFSSNYRTILHDMRERYEPNATHLLDGHRADASLAPESATKESKAKKLPDFFTLQSLGWACPKEFIDIVEGFEPGLHQFIPIKLFWNDGTEVPRDYWIINVCARLDTVAEMHSSVRRYPEHPNPYDPDRFSYRFKQGPRTLAVYRDRIEGHAMWWDWRTVGGFMWSDALWEAVEAAGLKGWEAKMDIAEV